MGAVKRSPPQALRRMVGGVWLRTCGVWKGPFRFDGLTDARSASFDLKSPAAADWRTFLFYCTAPVEPGEDETLLIEDWR